MFMARPIKEAIEEALDEVPKGQIVKVPISADQRYLVDFIVIGGVITWIDDPKPYQGSSRIYRDQLYVCAKRARG